MPRVFNAVSKMNFIFSGICKMSLCEMLLFMIELVPNAVMVDRGSEACECEERRLKRLVLSVGNRWLAWYCEGYGLISYLVLSLCCFTRDPHFFVIRGSDSPLEMKISPELCMEHLFIARMTYNGNVKAH